MFVLHTSPVSSKDLGRGTVICMAPWYQHILSCRKQGYRVNIQGLLAERKLKNYQANAIDILHEQHFHHRREIVNYFRHQHYNYRNFLEKRQLNLSSILRRLDNRSNTCDADSTTSWFENQYDRVHNNNILVPGHLQRWKSGGEKKGNVSHKTKKTSSAKTTGPQDVEILLTLRLASQHCCPSQSIFKPHPLPGAAPSILQQSTTVVEPLKWAAN